jgi:probable HAF family extracellular repeat protein
MIRFSILGCVAAGGAIVAMVAGCGGAGSPGGLNSVVPNSPAQHAAGSIPRFYTLTDIGSGLPGSPGLVPSGLNDEGTVVGTASANVIPSLPSCGSSCGPPEAWIFRNGTLTELPPLGSDFVTVGDSINDVGYASGGSAGYVTEEAVLWSPTGRIINLGTGILGSQSSAEAISISNTFNIAGASYNYYSEVPTAFDGKGGASAPCGSNTQGQLQKVNDFGLATGVMFLYQGGGDSITCPPLTIVGSPPDPTFYDYGWSINDKAQSVGRLSVGPAFGNFHPYLYQRGKTTDLGTLFPGNPNAVGSAFGINESGTIVGWSAKSGGTPGYPPVDLRAFVYSDGTMVDINSLLSSRVRSKWTVGVAKSINSRNQIVAVAYYGGYPNGVEHAVLLTPQENGPKRESTRTIAPRAGWTKAPSRAAWMKVISERAKRSHLDW